MIRGLLTALILCASPASLFAESKSNLAFEGWPASWVEAYLRFEAFIEAREKYWDTYDLEILPHGESLHYARYVERSRGAGLTIESTYNGRRLPFITKPPAEYFEYFPSMTASAALKLGTEQGYQYGLPVVWYEITADTTSPSARRHNNYIYRKLPINGNNTDFFPNNRILHFFDFHILPGGHPWDVFGENRRVSPSLRITINNEGLIERDVLAEPAVEKLLRWIVYKDGKLIVDQPVNGNLNFSPGADMGAYVAFLAVQGRSGYLPVSNVLFYPLFPTTTGATSLWPEDLNRNKSLDVLYLKADNPNALSAKEKFQAQQLWDEWDYNINTFRMQRPDDFGWKKPGHEIKKPILPPYDLRCRTDESGNYVFSWRSLHPQGKVWIEMEDPNDSGAWKKIVIFNYSQLAPPTDTNEYTITLDKSMQLLSTEPPESRTKLRGVSDQNFRIVEHRPYPQEADPD